MNDVEQKEFWAVVADNNDLRAKLAAAEAGLPYPHDGNCFALKQQRDDLRAKLAAAEAEVAEMKLGRTGTMMASGAMFAELKAQVARLREALGENSD